MKGFLQNQQVRWFLKLLFVAVLLYFLTQKGFLSATELMQAFRKPEYILGSACLLAMGSFLGIYRWHLLLRGVGIVIPFRRVVQLSFIGYFFNIALPGAVSGDFVKALYVSKETEERGSKLFGTILFDRVVGVSALVLVCALGMMISSSDLIHQPLFKTFFILVLLAACFVVLFYSYLFFVHKKDFVLGFLVKAEQRVKKVSSLKRVYLAIKEYSSVKGVVFQTLWISVIIHALVSCACYFFLKAFDVHGVSFFSVMAISPLGLLVTAIPIMPAGIGTGHVAFSALYLLFGTKRGGDVFSLVALFNIIQGVVGAFIYLPFKNKNSISIATLSSDEYSEDQVKKVPKTSS